MNSPSKPMFSFFNVQSREQAVAHLARFARLPSEEVATEDALGRVTAIPVKSPESLPPFRRSNMDGFAVSARDTFGASESSPAQLEVAGEVLMGKPAGLTLSRGQAARISTGGMLPEGADAVVMLEYCRDVDAKTIETTRAVAPGANMTDVGEDAQAGKTVLEAAQRLRPQDLGLLSALGITRVSVVRRPRLAILSTGNEVVPPEATPAPGQIRDVNSRTIAALSNQLGATTTTLGLVSDNPQLLREAVGRGLAEADVVVVSGGSSVGAADWTLKTFMSFEGAELLVHGVAIKPGKPVIVVKVGDKALIGLPGHVASSMVTYRLIVRPLVLRYLLGARDEPWQKVRAILSRNLAASPGRETWISVKLEETGAGLVAKPMLGPSSVISTLVEAHGLICVPMGSEGLYEGAAVDVELF